MKCRHCKQDGLPEHAIYCCWCGKKLAKAKDEISVPKPRKKKDGTYTAQIMIDGKRVSVPPQISEAKYYALARAMRSGAAEIKLSPSKITLGEAMDKYINNRDKILSPSTAYGYQRIRKNRFQAYIDKDIHSINYQQMVNEEFKLCGAKTLKNAWGFAKSALKSQDIPVNNITLPQIISNETTWLDNEQIKVFIKAMDTFELNRKKPLKDNDYRIGALLALHSLRRSEVLGISPSKIVDGKILVEGSVVVSDKGMVSKDTNKNSASRREVPIMIPRLKELIAESATPADTPYVINGNGLWKYVRDVCESADLPPCTPHSLRRSFASLAYSLRWSELECQRVGGWSDFQVLHKIYIRLSAQDKSKATKKMEKFYSEGQKNSKKKRSRK